MPALGLCIIPSGVNMTYKTRELNYYVLINPNASLTLSEPDGNPGPVNVNYSIWGGGIVKIAGSVVMRASMEPPSQAEINGLEVFTYISPGNYIEQL